jgi:hypothetical protein
MKLLDHQVTAESLAELGTEVLHLLCRGEIGHLAERYGYALSYGREPAAAIREDLNGCLSSIGAASLAMPPQQQVPRVLFYKPDNSNLLAVVECLAPSNNGTDVLVELIVTADGANKYITLEHLSNAV